MAKFKIQALLIPETHVGASEELSRSAIGSTKRFLHLANPKSELHTVMEEISARFKKLYPSEDELHILKLQDSRLCDLDPDYVLEDVLESEDLLRVIVSNSFHKTLPSATPIGNKSSDLAQSTPLMPSAPALIDDSVLPNSRKRTQAYFDQIDPHLPRKSAKNSNNYHLEAPKLVVKKTRKRSSPVYDADDSNISLPPPESEANRTIPVKPFIPSTSESNGDRNNGRITSGMLSMPIHTQLEKDDILQSPHKEFTGSPSSSINSFSSLDDDPKQYTVHPETGGDQSSRSNSTSSYNSHSVKEPVALSSKGKLPHSVNNSAHEDTLSKQEILDIFKNEIIKPHSEIENGVHKSPVKYDRKLPKKLIRSLEIDMVEGNTALSSIPESRKGKRKSKRSSFSKDASKMDSDDESTSSSGSDLDYIDKNALSATQTISEDAVGNKLPVNLKGQGVITTETTSLAQVDNTSSAKTKVQKSEKHKPIVKKKGIQEVNIDPTLVSNTTSPNPEVQVETKPKPSEWTSPSKSRLIHLLNKLRSFESQLNSYKQGNDFTPELLRKNDAKEDGPLDHTIKLTNAYSKVLKDGKIKSSEKALSKSNVSSAVNSPIKVNSSNGAFKHYNSKTLFTETDASKNTADQNKEHKTTGKDDFDNVPTGLTQKLKTLSEVNVVLHASGNGQAPDASQGPKVVTETNPAENINKSILNPDETTKSDMQNFNSSTQDAKTDNSKIQNATPLPAVDSLDKIAPASSDANLPAISSTSHPSTPVQIKSPSPTKSSLSKIELLNEQADARGRESKSPRLDIPSSQPSKQKNGSEKSAAYDNMASSHVGSKSLDKILNKDSSLKSFNSTTSLTTASVQNATETPNVPQRVLPKLSRNSSSENSGSKRKFDDSTDDSTDSESSDSDSDAEVSESKRPRLVTSVPAAKKSQSPLAVNNSKPVSTRIESKTPSQPAGVKPPSVVSSPIKGASPPKSLSNVVTPVSNSTPKQFSSSKIKKPILTSLEDLALRGVPEVKESTGRSTPIASQQPKKSILQNGSSSEDESESESDSDSSSDSDDSSDEESEKFISMKKITNKKPKKKGNLFGSLKR